MSSYPREPRPYELMAIILPDLPEEDLTAAIDRVSGYITDVNGQIREILQTSPWGRRRLAYTIRFNGTDYRDGHYVIWHFDLIPSEMRDIERELKLDTRVIRYLIVHEDPKWGSPQEREAAVVAAQAAVEAAAAAEAAEVATDEEASAESAIDVASTEGVEADTAVAEAEAVDGDERASVEEEHPATEPEPAEDDPQAS